MLSAFRNFGITFLIAGVVFGLIAWPIVKVVSNTLSDQKKPSQTVETTSTAETVPETQESQIETAPPKEIKGSTFNLLFIGTDYQPERYDDYDYEEKWQGPGFPDKRNRRYSADTLIFLRVDKENRRFTFATIPSNTLIKNGSELYAYGDTYYDHDLTYFINQAKNLVGFNDIHYMIIDVADIAEIVDLLGGFDFYIPEDIYEIPEPVETLPETEPESLPAETSDEETEPPRETEPETEPEPVILLKKGLGFIDGEKAQILLRYPNYSGGETARLNVSVQFLQYIINRFTNYNNKDNADKIYEKLSGIIETDFTVEDFTANKDLIFSYSEFALKTAVYPGTERVLGGVPLFEPNLDAGHKLFKK